jgi:hypothetical protein
MLMLRNTALAALLTAFTGTASADIIFYTNSTDFGNAVTAASLLSLGIEDFESSMLPDNNLQRVDDALQPGVPSTSINPATPFPPISDPVFPTGTSTATNITVQSSASPGDGIPFFPQPRGTDALVTSSMGFFDTPDDQIGSNFPSDSLDLLFSSTVLEPVLAVSLIPLFFDDITFDPESLGTITVRVFDSTNTFLLATDVLNVDYVNEIGYLGIVATGGMDIGRINLWDGNAVNHTQGVDDIEVFVNSPVVPIPAAAWLFGSALLGLGVVKRRKA